MKRIIVMVSFLRVKTSLIKIHYVSIVLLIAVGMTVSQAAGSSIADLNNITSPTPIPNATTTVNATTPTPIPFNLSHHTAPIDLSSED